jgi:hypothetical protein
MTGGNGREKSEVCDEGGFEWKIDCMKDPVK